MSTCGCKCSCEAQEVYHRFVIWDPSTESFYVGMNQHSSVSMAEKAGRRFVKAYEDSDYVYIGTVPVVEGVTVGHYIHEGQ